MRKICKINFNSSRNTIFLLVIYHQNAVPSKYLLILKIIFYYITEINLEHHTLKEIYPNINEK